MYTIFVAGSNFVYIKALSRLDVILKTVNDLVGQGTDAKSEARPIGGRTRGSSFPVASSPYKGQLQA
jgi:hypothetical protein